MILETIISENVSDLVRASFRTRSYAEDFERTILRGLYEIEYPSPIDHPVLMPVTAIQHREVGHILVVLHDVPVAAGSPTVHGRVANTLRNNAAQIAKRYLEDGEPGIQVRSCMRFDGAVEHPDGSSGMVTNITSDLVFAKSRQILGSAHV